MIRILYFGNLPDLLGRAIEEIPLPAGVLNVSGLLASLAARGGVWGNAFADSGKLKITVNRQFAGLDMPIADGAEIALVAFVSD
jgi:molybdopterin synthase sulfur carrier subunit